MGDLVCIHGIDKSELCNDCVLLSTRRLARTIRVMGIRASEAGARLKKFIETIPEEYWDMLDAEVEKREQVTIQYKKRIIKINILILSAVAICVIVLWQVIVKG